MLPLSLKAFFPGIVVLLVAVGIEAPAAEMLSGQRTVAGTTIATQPTVVRYTQRSWNMSDGLPRNAVQSLLQTRDGYVWIGTTAGVARFDGIRFNTFESQLSRELAGAFIRDLAQTADGTVWIAADKHGLASFRDGTITRDARFDKTAVRAIHPSNNGQLWVGTTNGAAVMDKERLVWITAADGLPKEDVLSLCEDRSGNVWIGTGGGLVRYTNGKIAEHFHDAYFLPVNQVRVLFCDSRGALWIGTSGGGVTRFHRGKWSYFKKEQGIPDLFVTSIFEDRSGNIWASTLGGVARLEEDHFVRDLFTEEGSADEAVYTITEDHEGSLWIGTKEGLHQLRRRVFTTYTRQNGLTHNNVLAIREGNDGTMWLATWGGGINGIRGTNVFAWSSGTNQVADLMLSALQSSDGAFWFGADYDSGLFRWNGKDVSRFHAANGIIDPAIRVLHEDKTGALWFGTTGAVYRHREGKFERFGAAHGGPGLTVRAIAEDATGNLWFGASDGLAMLPAASTTEFNTREAFLRLDGLPTKQVLSILPDRNGTIWITVDGDGIWRFRVSGSPCKADAVRNYSKAHGLSSDTIFEIAEDNRGYLWMSTLSGVARIRKSDFDALDRGELSTLPSVWFGKADGMASEQCNGVSKPTIWKAEDGRLWFATTRGVAVVDSAAIHEHIPAPRVLIEEIVADKKIQLADGSSFVIPPGKGDLEIRFTALSFKAPEKNRFRYKLEGADSEWIDAVGRRFANYNHLPPGRYSFRVTASNGDGVWNQSGAVVHLVLQPHFWQTRWFLILSIVVGVTSVASAGRYAAWSILQKRLRRLEQQHAVEKERARIAQDMHDDLGARLSEILLLSELTREPNAKTADIASRLDRISCAAKDLVDNLDAIVWAVNPKNDSCDRFVFYLIEYLSRYLESTGIQHCFDLPDPLPKFPIGSACRHNLFLVVKEALHNVVKHAAAGRVRLSVRVEQGRLTLEIADNGKGFSQQPEQSMGNGLANMRERVEKLGGTFALESKSGCGTAILLSVPVPPGQLQN